MSTTTNKKGQNASDQSLLDKLLADGAAELRLDRAIYAAEVCKGAPLVGFIVDMLEMPAIDAGKSTERDWQAFVFLTTYDTKGVDREKNVVDVSKGEEIIIPATFQIKTALARFARDPDKMHEIGLQPKTKIDVGGGKEMWTYRVIATGNTKERGTVYALVGQAQPAQLGQTSSGAIFDKKTGEVKDNVVTGKSATA